MSCEMLNKRCKKKRTIANLLRTDQTLEDFVQEKKTYIKQYFENQNSTPPKTPETKPCPDSPLPSVTDLPTPTEDPLSPNIELPTTLADPIPPFVNKNPILTLSKASRGKVKDYVVAAEVLKPIKLAKDSQPPPLTISKMTNSEQSPVKTSFKLSTDSGTIQKANNLEWVRLSCVRQRSSKIKDYINNENVSSDVNNSLLKENIDTSLKPSTEMMKNNTWINVMRKNSLAPRLIKPNYLQIPCNKLPVVNISQEIANTKLTAKSKFVSSRVKKPKRTRPKIKDYMLTETPMSLTNTKKLISSLTTENKSSKKIINLFPRKLKILKKSAVSSVPGTVKDENATVSCSRQQQAKSTIKDYLQGRTLQSIKCSRSQLLKNKENLGSKN